MLDQRLPDPAIALWFLSNPPSSCENCCCARAMVSTSSSTAVDERERERKRKRNAGGDSRVAEGAQAKPSKWRTRREHEIYSSKLLDALRLVRSGGSRARGREVRDAADRALAVAARGRSRWSRAILACRRRALRARLRAPALPPPAASSAQPALARKAKVLGRLVPGCRKLPFPALLAEASDYIAALEMQVRAMTALAQALSSVGSSSSSSPSPA